ncbi:hypothetical protein [Bradyrhizobium sp. Cp5.3]|uniref:hypothetical protein n=1 Tax=Bradyrhizobium sp. Cp5.3 TaxID=443598 RepID=UPI001FDA6A8E|nr:hypothetical protein [Bradyrhizobium sp. Cp5.3]
MIVERLSREHRNIEALLAIPERELDFIEHERHHMMMEHRDFFPAVPKALKPQDWTEIASAVTGRKDPLFSDVPEERFDALSAHISLRLAADAERNWSRFRGCGELDSEFVRIGPG